MGSSRPNPTHVSWVGLGWVEFFFLLTMGGWVKKSPQSDLTRPMHTPNLTN